jgi:RNA polymerase sigma-70 factor (ECF subfamily)
MRMSSPDATGSFPSSHWSLIARANQNDPAFARAALEELCRRYWYPLYVFIRRQVSTHQEAEDITQGFFAHLLGNAVIAQGDPARGRFRTYLLSCCRNYLSNQLRAKRNRREETLPLDLSNAEGRYSSEPAEPNDPVLLYVRRWAFTMLDDTFDAIESQYREEGREELFDRLKLSLTGDRGDQSYAAIGEAVGLSENAVKKAAQRLRSRFGEELRRRVADTVADPAAVEDEIRDLFAAVR